jgi:hypothetical protein
MGLLALQRLMSAQRDRRRQQVQPRGKLSLCLFMSPVSCVRAIGLKEGIDLDRVTLNLALLVLGYRLSRQSSTPAEGENQSKLISVLQSVTTQCLC